MNYILASASPRRKELLTQMGITDFQIIKSTVEERITKTIPAEIVEELSEQKCVDVAKTIKLPSSYLVIGADTIVADHGHILGKPKDEAHAFAMLSNLRGHEHSVFTGVTLCLCDNGMLQKKVTFHEETKVFMRSFSEEEIKAYITTKEPMDKAGSYGIQGRGAILVEKIHGDYNNVVGLPITRLYEEIKRLCQTDS